MFNKKKIKELEDREQAIILRENALKQKENDLIADINRQNNNAEAFKNDQKTRIDSVSLEIDKRLEAFSITQNQIVEQSKDGINKLYDSHNELTQKELKGIKENFESLKETTSEILNSEKQHLIDDYKIKLDSIIEQKKEIEDQLIECRDRESVADQKYKDAERDIHLYHELERNLKEEFESKENLLDSRIKRLSDLNNQEYMNKNSQLENSFNELKRIIQEVKEEDLSRLESIYKNRIEASNKHITLLGQELTSKSQELNSLSYIKDAYQDDPDNLIKELREKNNSINNLKSLLADKNIELDRYKEIAPTSEELKSKVNQAIDIRIRYEEDFKELTSYKEKAAQLDDFKETLALFKARGRDIEEEIDRKTKENKELNIENEVLNNKLSDKKIPREDRIKTIEKSYVSLNTSESGDSIVKISDPEFYIEEKEFLKKIKDGIESQGYKFEDRLINAFHTSLKCSDMAIITVLAGVSGTGKSTLGKLYSYYGGFIFNSTAVQPNWDSTEDLLGYYDSIGNSFNPTEVLRLLYQSQSSTKDHLHIILLDEMNLAHIELYLNQFLSKLEERRGNRKGEFSYIDVNLGSGEDSLKLELRDNVFWLGTMNNDETVKNLSAKVIDRGNNLFFPSPDEFQDTIKPAEKNKEAKLLNKSNWDKWMLNKNDINLNIFTDLIDNKKKNFNEIHKVMVKLNKSIGHRGWQTIEMYLCNYPGVKSLAESLNEMEDEKNKLNKPPVNSVNNIELEVQRELESLEDNIKNKKEEIEKLIDTAYEDIVAMKLFPKLNGSDCSDENKEDLEELKRLLPEGLHTDFDNAISIGNELFQQVSSLYLTRNNG